MKNLWVIGVAFFFFFGCQSEMEKDAAATQEENIKNYITWQLSSDTTITLVTNNHSYRLIKEKGQGNEIAFGDSISFAYIGYIFSSNGNHTRFDTNIDTLGFMPTINNGKGIFYSGRYISGLENGLLGMKEGEKSQIIFSSSQGYGNNAVGLVPPLSALVFDIKMITVKKQ